ncbi:MAG: signal peptidase I [Acidobacteriota bacterium]
MKKCSFIFLIFLLLVNFGCAVPVKMEGISMLPNIKEGDRLIVNTEYGELKRGDVIVHLYPRDQTRFYIKRIIGLPNETIEIKAGKVFINDSELNENYLDQNYNQSQSNLSARKIEAGSYFVMGDNRDNSSDSRLWGTVKKELIQGTLLLNYGNNK